MVFTPGINNCPFSMVGYITFILGHRFKRSASEISVKEPDINAWLAITAAVVAIIMPGSLNHCGIIPKKALKVSAVWPLISTPL
jgi:hypothetical protein